MKKYLTILVLISVLGIGIFGFTAMGHNDPMVGCIASVVKNTPCPETSIGMSLYHIQAYTTFFSVLPLLPYITLFILIGFFLYRYLLFDKNKLRLKLRQIFIKDDKRQLTNFSLKIIRWLSLFENSPSIA